MIDGTVGFGMNWQIEMNGRNAEMGNDIRVA